jgi:hypothetical protein
MRRRLGDGSHKHNTGQFMPIDPVDLEVIEASLAGMEITSPRAT